MVLLQLLQIVVRQHHRVPTVLLGQGISGDIINNSMSVKGSAAAGREVPVTRYRCPVAGGLGHNPECRTFRLCPAPARLTADGTRENAER
jgi:hypothetical protein